METEVIELRQLALPKRSPFGEFLVEQSVLDRFQLFRVLQLQDRVPGTRLGACAVVLGFAATEAIEQLHRRFAQKIDPEAELDAAATTAFHREPEIEIIFEPAL
ncbi:MAG TPA: hypothetical protein VIV11_01440 [Kofleriaceae bacterium]